MAFAAMLYRSGAILFHHHLRFTEVKAALPWLTMVLKICSYFLFTEGKQQVVDSFSSLECLMLSSHLGPRAF